MTSFGTSDLHEQEKETAIRAKPGELLKRVSYEKDKVIFREGHDGTDAYVLESGRVGVFKTIEGKSVRLTTIEKGAMFGEMAAITGERRTATTIALEPCVIVRISKITIQQKIAACDPFVRALINILINNLTRVTDRYATTNVVAEKLLAELKATQIEKEEPAPAAAAAPAAGATTDKTGPRGKDGGVS
jgi:CRP/FNR family cyclic AMP-dependent transcriptional regulator